MLDNVVLRHDNGIITAIAEGRRPRPGRAPSCFPAFVNAHDHARPTASSFGAVGMPLESWILRSALGTPVDPYLTAASALARSARAGCAAMMVHYTRPSGTMPLVEEAKAIARAASDVGIRIAFAIAVRDQNPIVYGDGEPVLSDLSGDDRKTIEELFVRAPMSPKAYIELTDAIAAAIAGPKVDVQLGAGRRAVVLKAVARSGRREFGADRPPHPHASPGNRLSARLGRPEFPARRRPLSPRYRFPLGAPDAGAWHPRQARRARNDRGVRRAHRHQFQLQHASALRPRPDRRRVQVRLRHRGRRRWPCARRGRRRLARDAPGADDARRPRLQADLDFRGVFCARDPERPQRDWRAGEWRTCARARLPIS